jgi:hypothetical protein
MSNPTLSPAVTTASPIASAIGSGQLVRRVLFADEYPPTFAHYRGGPGDAKNLRKAWDAGLS